MTDLECNHCGKDLEWGMEYPLPDGEDDHDAVCSDCWKNIPVSERYREERGSA